VVVLGTDPTNKVTIDTRAASSPNTELPPRPAPNELAANERASDVTAPPLSKIGELVVDIPDAAELTIYLHSTDAQRGTGSTTLAIREPLYFVRAGLAFTWVDRGTRTITAEHAIVEQTNFFPGVALSFWPWGHRGHALSALERRRWGRSFGDAIGLQIGTDLDFTRPFDRAFFGPVIEPIAGLGIGGGVAVTTGQYFSGAPADSTMAVVDRRMWRPYFSLTLTTELFDTLKKLASTQDDPKP
jgi:hypothetical protein